MWLGLVSQLDRAVREDAPEDSPDVAEALGLCHRALLARVDVVLPSVELGLQLRDAYGGDRAHRLYRVRVEGGRAAGPELGHGQQVGVERPQHLGAAEAVDVAAAPAASRGCVGGLGVSCGRSSGERIRRRAAGLLAAVALLELHAPDPLDDALHCVDLVLFDLGVLGLRDVVVLGKVQHELVVALAEGDHFAQEADLVRGRDLRPLHKDAGGQLCLVWSPASLLHDDAGVLGDGLELGDILLEDVGELLGILELVECRAVCGLHREVWGEHDWPALGVVAARKHATALWTSSAHHRLVLLPHHVRAGPVSDPLAGGRDASAAAVSS
ncbi:hypothetical protein BJ166DRAFT_130403 [Pestalotiopsis sp. NC0098]|nr:hypothetical protein BJ166DRAFT_130403 [Pestalotiopsis sp. NC0098]